MTTSIYGTAQQQYGNIYPTGTTNPTATDSNGLFDVTLVEVKNKGTGGNVDEFVSNAPGCADGKDDGKIGFGETVGSFFKGLVKPITSMFESPGNFIKGALGIAAGAALIAVTGGAAAPFLIGAGVVGGVVTGGKGVINAMNATTDAEAKAALEDVGTGTFMVGSSLLGAKKYQSSVTGQKMGFGKSLAKTLNPKNLKAEGIRSFKNIGTSAKNMFAGTKTDLLKYGETTTKNSTKTETKPEVKKTETKAKAKTEPEVKTVDEKMVEQAKATHEANRNQKASTPENANSPQNRAYQDADDIKLTSEEYAARGKAQVDKFNNKTSQADLDYMDKRIANAKTPAAKKALLEQKKLMEAQLKQTAPTTETQTVTKQEVPTVPETATNTTNLSPKELKVSKNFSKMSDTELADWITTHESTASENLLNLAKQRFPQTPSVTSATTAPTTSKPVVFENTRGAQGGVYKSINEMPPATDAEIAVSNARRSARFKVA